MIAMDFLSVINRLIVAEEGVRDRASRDKNLTNCVGQSQDAPDLQHRAQPRSTHPFATTRAGLGGVGRLQDHSPLGGYKAENRPRLSAAKPRSISEEAEQSTRSSLPDTPNGKSSRLLATALTMESLPALTKVVEPSTGRITL